MRESHSAPCIPATRMLLAFGRPRGPLEQGDTALGGNIRTTGTENRDINRVPLIQSKPAPKVIFS